MSKVKYASLATFLLLLLASTSATEINFANRQVQPPQENHQQIQNNFDEFMDLDLDQNEGEEIVDQEID